MFFKRCFLFIVCAVVATSFGASETNACSCGRKSTILEAYEQANIVVIAQVVSVEKSAESERSVDGVRSTRMIVEKAFKGTLSPGEEMVFGQGGGGDCIWTFHEKDIGERYLFYLSPRRKGDKLWFAFYCGRSKNAEYAADDLLYLENLSKVRGKTRLSGTLSFSQAPAVEDQEPIHNSPAGKKVKIIGEKKTYELITNRDGVYEVYDLPAGKYVIEPEVPDGWKIDHRSVSANPRKDDGNENGPPKKDSSQVFLEAGKHCYFDFGYGVNNAIRGKVFDTAGNGLENVCLSMVPAKDKTSRNFFESNCTRKDGGFEIVGISPGSYVIAVNTTGRISSSAPFPTFYYPNVVDREKAAVFTIGAGQMLEGIDIYVPKMEETITVEGVLLHSDGRPVIEEWVQFEAQKPGNGVDGNARAQTDSTGRFAVKILKGLEGTLYAVITTYPGEYENCPKLDEITGKYGLTTISTNLASIRADVNVTNIELKYPFPDCKKAK